MPPSPLPPGTFRNDVCYRSTLGGRRRPAVECGFILKPDGEAYRDRTLPHYVAVAVLRGRGTFIDDHGREHPLSPGCVAQHPPNRVHSMIPEPDGQWAEFFFIVPSELYEALVKIGCVDDAPVLRPGIDAAMVARFEALLAEIRSAPEDSAAAGIATAHSLLAALHAAHHAGRRPAPESDLIAQACAWLGDCEQDVDARVVAQRLNLSYERFRKLFRQRMGLPPGEYRIRRRVDRARTLIAQDRLSNKEVAYRLRYPDPFTFSKQFKRYTGVSPDAFRRAL